MKMRIFSLTGILALAASLASALLANARLTERISLIGDFIGLTLSHNPGIAFGVLLPPILQELLIFAALVAVGFFAWKSPRTPLPLIGYGLIVGGALGNIIDRLPDGLVTDFFQVGSFPVFNVADSCITIGVVFVLASTIKIGRSSQQ